MITSFYWHDYETFGVDPVHDRPAQFAGVRTDTELNIIEEPLVIYCQPTEDYLPDPTACLITGITPQKAREDGYPEAEFIRQIHDAFNQPGTCVVGYNSLRFDDEVTRHTLYRNLRDPYAREWKNGNSRWDIIDMVRLTYALRPEGINWPTKEDGSPSFRLEDLTAANGISHESAHDAMSDVEATIAMARLIRERQPRLFNYVLDHKDKHSARAMLDLATRKPVFHVSSKYPAAQGCSALVAPVAQHPANRNAVIVYDLRHDPEELIRADSDKIRERVFSSSARPVPDQPDPKAEQSSDAGPQARFPLKAIHLNKCPVMAPSAMLRDMPEERLDALGLDGPTLRINLDKLRQAPDLGDRIASAFMPTEAMQGSLTDPDEQLYAGGFLSNSDRKTLDNLLTMPAESLAKQSKAFDDDRLEEMLFRYRARNYPVTLSAEEQARWEEFRQQRLINPGKGWRSLEGFFEDIQSRLASGELSDTNRLLLEELYLYGESLIPYG